MALIECKECGKEVSSMASSCPHCGFPINRIVGEYKTVDYEKSKECVESRFEINGVNFDIKEIQKKAFIKTVANVTNKVKKLCKCEYKEAEMIVYGYFLSTHGERIEDKEKLREKISQIRSWNEKDHYCPYCLGTRISKIESVHELTTKGRSEVRKKSAITRAGNKAGRAGMIMATGGLWALTPKKSEYNEVSQARTTYHTTVTKTCTDCGMRIM